MNFLFGNILDSVEYKIYRQNKFYVSTYILSILYDSINVLYTTNEYFPIREYSDIFMIMLRKCLTLVKMCHRCLQRPEICTNVPQMPSTSMQVCQFTLNYIRATYTCTKKIFVQHVPYCARWVCIGSMLNKFPNKLLAYISSLRACQPSEPLLSCSIVLTFPLQ